MIIDILFGTESGNAELVAEDLAEALGNEHEVRVIDLADADVDGFRQDSLYLIICSTHGEGDLPQSAEPFAAAVRENSPDLAGVRYAMFGLGDSTYPNYGRGGELIDELLQAHGATRVGTFGRHDAAGRAEPGDLTASWASDVLLGARLPVPTA
ncbi:MULTISPECIES: flavodoxin domain-containing protein [Arthrobacter]|nr:MULTISPECIES: flavodoxin domain-containing protein [Arthrobacter]MBT8161937.1 flavodoxin domain-containing protein [Arthrobacter sp. GN70]